MLHGAVRVLRISWLTVARHLLEGHCWLLVHRHLVGLLCLPIYGWLSHHSWSHPGVALVVTVLWHELRLVTVLWSLVVLLEWLRLLLLSYLTLLQVLGGLGARSLLLLLLLLFELALLLVVGELLVAIFFIPSIACITTLFAENLW